MLPAKVIPDKQLAFVSFGGEEIEKSEFEVLRSGDFVWEFAQNGKSYFQAQVLSDEDKIVAMYVYILVRRENCTDIFVLRRDPIRCTGDRENC